tara:strand:- start:9759 stop:10688 length:930 start_codon:yes stop_codon:yes gene_type:complete
MLANFFDKTKPINSIVLVIAFFLFYTIYRYNYEPTTFIDFTTFERLTHIIGSTLFLLISGLVFIKNGVSNGNLLNSFLMILLYGMFPSAFEVNKTLGIVFLFLLIYKNISELKVSGRTQLNLFDSGLLAGVSFLIFNMSIVFILFIFIGLFFSKKIDFRTLISPVLGLINPIILYFTYCFFTDSIDDFYRKFDFIYSLDASLYSSLSVKIPLILISITTGIAIITVFPKVISVSNKYRYQFQLLLTMLFIGSLLVFISPQKNGSEFLYVFIPIAAIHGKFIKTISNEKVKEFFIIGLAIFSITLLCYRP